MASNESFQTAIDDAIHQQFHWHAELYFNDVEGHENPLELFQFTNKECFTAQRSTVKHERKHLVIFDRKKYPPDKDGIKKLSMALKTEGIRKGTNLISRNNPLVLSCYRCKKHTPSQSAEEALHTQSNTQQEQHSAESEEDPQFDEDGIMLGIRSYRIHRDKAQARANGKTTKRGTFTMRPIQSDQTCKVSLRLGVQEGPNGYIFLKQGCGHATHSFHPKPCPGDVPFRTRHLKDSTRQLILSARTASTGSTAIRYLVLQNQHKLVGRGTIQHVQMVPEFLRHPSENHSTAFAMVSWLREKSQDSSVNLRYCFLSCNPLHDPGYHCHPKGRPPQQGRISIKEVRKNMEYDDVLQSTFRVGGPNTEEKQESHTISHNDDSLHQSVKLTRTLLSRRARPACRENDSTGNCLVGRARREDGQTQGSSKLTPYQAV